ncbi:hypothetical protein AC1031_021238 [Aphanomyces cochlioides]|nr:hypothetical protein AC1031_021238 [Aphanomyces cochlioides]
MVLWIVVLVIVFSVFSIVINLINTIFWIVVIVLGTICQLREWLGWKHENEAFQLVLDMKYHDAAFYRANAKRFDTLLSERHAADKAVHALVKAQIEEVAELIQGGRTFIEVKDTMTLSTVVVSTLFYAAYFIYFWQHQFVLGSVNSKVYDALAIILPFLLQEELTVALSQVLLWTTWITANLDFGNLLVKWMFLWIPCVNPDDNLDESDNQDGSPEPPSKAKAVLRRHKLEFDNRVNYLCSGIGVGAIDMNGPATFITSIWTLFFLIQGYIVETYGEADNSNHLFNFVVAERHAMAWVYWALDIYSGVLILFCFLPFFCKSSEQQKEEFESVASSCETYLFIKHMTTLPDRKLKVTVAYPAVRQLRQQAIHQLGTNDVFSYALYVLALHTYNFFTGQVDGVAIEDLKKGNAKPKIQSQLMPINQEESYYWNASLGDIVECGNVDDALPTFLLRVPTDGGGQKATPPSEMTLFSIPMMGVQTFEDVLTERKVTEMGSIYDNQLVQEKKIFLCQDRSQAELVCIGVEVKIMEAYPVSMYIAAEQGARFGRGCVYVVANSLESEIQLTTKTSANPLGFKEVADEDHLRAFAMCTLDIDPAKVTRPLKTAD